MSSILKSLRKVQKEKYAETQAAPDLMTDQGAVPVKPSPFLPLLAGIVLGAVAVGGWELWTPRETTPAVVTQSIHGSGEAPRGTDRPSQISGSMQADKTKDMLPDSSSSQERDLSGQGPGSRTEATAVTTVTLSPQPVMLPVNHTASPSTPVAKTTAHKKPGPEAVAIARIPSQTIQAPQKAEIATTTFNNPSDLPEGVSLLVSEIFYQEDQANSMAVVNDLPVMVGTSVDAAVVAEIFPDSVLFEIGGMTYLVDQSRP